MKRIYKYPFQINDRVTVELPNGAVLLDIQSQNGIPCMWALVDPNERLVKRELRIVGTGHDINEQEFKSLAYRRTFQQGTFVWHVFEIK